MSKLDKLQESVTQTQALIESLTADKNQAENAVINDPSNSEAAIKAATLEMQVKSAQKALERGRAAVEIEKERLNSKEYQAAQKKLKDLEQQAQKLSQEIKAAPAAIMEKIEAWEIIVNDYQGLARAHEIEPLPLYDVERNRDGLIHLKDNLFTWLEGVKYVEYFKRKHGG